MEKKTSKKGYVTRSTYQKVFEQNKQLMDDIRLLTNEGLSFQKIVCIKKWRTLFEAQENHNKKMDDFFEIIRQSLNKNSNKNTNKKTKTGQAKSKG